MKMNGKGGEVGAALKETRTGSTYLLSSTFFHQLSHNVSPFVCLESGHRFLIFFLFYFSNNNEHMCYTTMLKF